MTASDIRAARGGWLRGLAARIGWQEGWLTLRRIAAGLRLRSEGHISNMIRQCDRQFGADRALLELLDSTLSLLRA